MMEEPPQVSPEQKLWGEILVEAQNHYRGLLDPKHTAHAHSLPPQLQNLNSEQLQQLAQITEDSSVADKILSHLAQGKKADSPEITALLTERLFDKLCFNLSPIIRDLHASEERVYYFSPDHLEGPLLTAAFHLCWALEDRALTEAHIEALSQVLENKPLDPMSKESRLPEILALVKKHQTALMAAKPPATWLTQPPEFVSLLKKLRVLENPRFTSDLHSTFNGFRMIIPRALHGDKDNLLEIISTAFACRENALCHQVFQQGLPLFLQELLHRLENSSPSAEQLALIKNLQAACQSPSLNFPEILANLKTLLTPLEAQQRSSYDSYQTQHLEQLRQSIRMLEVLVLNPGISARISTGSYPEEKRRETSVTTETEIKQFTSTTNRSDFGGAQHLMDQPDPYSGGIRYWVLPDDRIYFHEYNFQGKFIAPIYLMGREDFLARWNEHSSSTAGNFQGRLRDGLRDNRLNQVFLNYTGLGLSQAALDPMKRILRTNPEDVTKPPQPFVILEKKRGRKGNGEPFKNHEQSPQFQAQNDLLLKIRANYHLDPDPQPDSQKAAARDREARRVGAVSTPTHQAQVEQHIQDEQNRPVLYLHPKAWDASTNEAELQQTLLTRDSRSRTYPDKNARGQDISKPFLKNTKHRIVAAKVLVLATMTRELPKPCPAVIVTACAPNFMNFGLGYKNEDLGRYLKPDHSALKDNGRPYKEDLKRIFKSSLYAMDQQGVKVGLIPLFGGGAYLSLLNDQAIAPNLSPKAHARQMIHEALIEAFCEMKTAGQFQSLEKIVYCLPRSEHKPDDHSSPYEAARTTLRVRQHEHPDWPVGDIELSEGDILEEAVHFQEGLGKSVGILNAGSNTTIGGAFQNPYYGAGPLEECLSCATTLVRQCAFDEVHEQRGRLADQYDIQALPDIVGHLPAAAPKAPQQASGKVKPILVEFDNSQGDADIERQAQEILEQALAEHQATGKPVGLTYSANQAQVIQVYENEHGGRDSYQRMTGANQAQVVDKIIELLGTSPYQALQPYFHILPLPTMNGAAESRSTAGQGEITVSHVSNALCHAACFVGAGGTLLAWQNQGSARKHELAAIGGGVAGSNPQVQDQIQNGLRQIQVLTGEIAPPQRLTDPSITAAFQQGRETQGYFEYWNEHPPQEHDAAASFRASGTQLRSIDGSPPKSTREVIQAVCRERYELNSNTYQLIPDTSALTLPGTHRLLIRNLTAPPPSNAVEAGGTGLDNGIVIGELTYQEAEPNADDVQSLSLTLTHPDGSDPYEHLAIAMIKFVRAQGHTQVEVPKMGDFENFKAAVDKHNQGQPKLDIKFADEAAPTASPMSMRRA